MPGLPSGHIELVRIAAKTYRAARQAGHGDYGRRVAARMAVQAASPEMTEDQAMDLVTNAVAFAAAHYPKWFWR
jgi:hypothetical protein